MDKEKIEAIQECINELHEVNFNIDNGIIRHSGFSYGNFSFANSYDGDKGKFKAEDSITGYCDACNDYDRPNSDKNKECKLCNISHGSHTFDFLEALGKDPQNLLDGDEWTDIPILFLMENPSKDYGIYDYINKDYNGKRPAKQWYWIHRKYDDDTARNIFGKDDYLVMSKYGEMVASLIYQFKLGNAYLTNVVKCGMSDTKYNRDTGKVEESVFLGTDYYQTACIRTCMKKILTKEILALCKNKKDLIVFAFGGNAHWYAKNYFQCFELGINVRLYQLPHPAGRMKNEYRPYVLKGIVAEALYPDNKSNKIIPGVKTDDAKALFKELNDKKGLTIQEGNYSSKHITYKIWENDSIFGSDTDSSKYLKELRIRDIRSNGRDNGAGYNFNTEEFWAWDYSKKEYLNFSDFRYSELLKSIIQELLTNPTNPNIDKIKVDEVQD